MNEYEIPYGNPVIVVLAMMEDGHKFEVVVPDDGRREETYQEVNGK